MRRMLQVGPRAGASIAAGGGAVPAGWVDVKKMGARGDGKKLIGGTTAGSQTFTLLVPGSPKQFAAADQGKLIAIAGAGASGSTFKTTIASVNSATECTLADPAPATMAAPGWVNAYAGSDDSAAIQSAINFVGAAGGGVIYFPLGVYLLWNNGLLVNPVYRGVSFAGASEWGVTLVYCGSEAAITIGDAAATSFTYYNGVEELEISITPAGPNAVGLLLGPQLYGDLCRIRITSQNQFPHDTNQQVGLLTRGGDLARHSFGAYVNWWGCQVSGRFKRGVWMTADGSGWGFNSCLFQGGAIVYASLTPTPEAAPAGYGYTGFHLEQGNQNVISLVDVENYDVAMRIDAFDNTLLAGRTEANRTWDLWLTEGDLQPDGTGHTGGSYTHIFGGGFMKFLDDAPGTSQVWGANVNGNVENHITNYAFLDTGLFLKPTSFLLWDGIGGSSCLFWRSAPDANIGAGVGDTGDMAVWSGYSALRVAAGTMSTGSNVLTLAKYPGGTIEPNLTAADEGSRILVVKAIDDNTNLDTTIVSVLSPTQCELAANAQQDVAGQYVRYGPAAEWDAQVYKNLVLDARQPDSQIFLRLGTLNKVVVDSGGVHLWAHQMFETNSGIVWNELGGSCGLAWQLPDPNPALPPILQGLLVNTGDAFEIRSGSPSVNRSLILEGWHEASTIQLRINGDTKLIVDSEGVHGEITASGLPSDPTFHGIVTVEAAGAPELRLTNTDALVQGGLLSYATAAGLQWGISLGLPATTNANLSIAEYQDGVLTAVRLVVARGGNVLIGKTDDDGTHLLQLAQPLAADYGGTGHESYVKGDLLVASAAAVLDRLPVGASNKFLVADSSQTTGLKWAALADIASPVFSGSVIVRDATSPALVLDNTGTGYSACVNIDHQGLRQWSVGAGLPGSNNRNWSIAEYNDGTYVDVRFVVAQGGNILIGSTTDDGSNKLQITGAAKITGALTLGTALSPLSGGTGLASFAKGDLVVATSAAALARLAVGTDGQALVADSTQASGIKWGKPALAFSDLSGTIANAQFPTNPQFSGLLKVSDSNGPELVVNNTGSVQSALFSIQHGGNREWLLGTGLPTNTNASFSIAEFNAGAYVAVRMVVAKTTGNVLIGSTTDNGQRLQVAGDGLVTGNLAVNGTATIATLQLTNALAILYGGTGATTAAGALANLGTDAALSVGGVTLTLAKITPGGSNGSITINSAGRVTAWVQPT